jgi:hypothetical protein
MTLFARLRYALYLAGVAWAIIIFIVAMGSADVVAVLPIGAFDALFNPLMPLAVYLLAFAITPWLTDHLPISRHEHRSS